MDLIEMVYKDDGMPDYAAWLERLMGKAWCDAAFPKGPVEWQMAQAAWEMKAAAFDARIEAAQLHEMDDHIKRLNTWLIETMQEDHLNIWLGGDVTERAMHVVQHYKSNYNQVLSAYAAFVEHVVVSLQALHMIAKAGYGLTHRQRNARTDVLCETIQETIRNIQDWRGRGYYEYTDTPFNRQDWDFRKLAAENWKLKHRIEELEKGSGDAEAKEA